MSFELVKALSSYGKAHNLDNNASAPKISTYNNMVADFSKNLANINALYNAEAINSAEPSTINAKKKSNSNGILAPFVENALNAIKNAEDVNFKALKGEASIADVVSSITQAEIKLKEIMGVRDKLVSAYNDVIKMQI